MFRRRFRGGARRSHTPKHWFREAGSIAIGASGTTTTTLLDASDYSGNTALSPSGVTLVRTIVDFSVVPTLAGANDQSGFHWALWVCDADTATTLGVVTGNLVDERVLDCGTMQMLTDTAGSVGFSFMRGPTFRVDTKQRVRMQDSELRLVFTETGGIAYTALYTVSCLLVGDTT